ncbi:hypothetical protein IFR05_016817, partial [Cadophora sp. M221]
WWKASEFQYPLVAKAVRDLQAIPSAEVDIERLFSEGRDVIGIRRMAMDADTMRILRLLKSHFDAQDKEIRDQARAQLEEKQRAHGVRKIDQGANQEPQN